MLRREINKDNRLIRFGILCKCVSCSNNNYSNDICKLPTIEIDEQGKCKYYRKRW